MRGVVFQVHSRVRIEQYQAWCELFAILPHKTDLISGSSYLSLCTLIFCLQIAKSFDILQYILFHILQANTVRKVIREI